MYCYILLLRKHKPFKYWYTFCLQHRCPYTLSSERVPVKGRNRQSGVGRALHWRQVCTTFTLSSLSFSPSSTVSAGHYLSHTVFSILCHVFIQLYFFMSSFMLSLHLIFSRPLLLVKETSSLSDSAQMWLCSRLK